MTQTEQTPGLTDIASRVWGEIGGPAALLDALTATGPRTVLPSQFDVTGLATASVAAATLAAAEFLAARTDGRPLPVTVDSRQACAAFAAEALGHDRGPGVQVAWSKLKTQWRAAQFPVVKFESR